MNGGINMFNVIAALVILFIFGSMIALLTILTVTGVVTVSSFVYLILLILVLVGYITIKNSQAKNDRMSVGAVDVIATILSMALFLAPLRPVADIVQKFLGLKDYQVFNAVTLTFFLSTLIASFLFFWIGRRLEYNPRRDVGLAIQAFAGGVIFFVLTFFLINFDTVIGGVIDFFSEREVNFDFSLATTFWFTTMSTAAWYIVIVTLLHLLYSRVSKTSVTFLRNTMFYRR